MVKIGIAGVGGRMGQAIGAIAAASDKAKVAYVFEAPGHKLIGSEAFGCAVKDSLKEGASSIDVLMDFTAPAATLKNLETAVAAGKAVVIGTTGFNADEIKKIHEASSKIPVVFSSNYSVGVNVMWKIVADAARIMREDYDVDIVESHHRHKKDSPSGTAVTTGQVIMEAKGLSYDDNVIYGREGRDNTRPRNQLGILAVRGGGVVGEHTVIFASDGDKLEIKHTSLSRETLASGAFKAALFIKGKKPGLYSMKDVLSI